MTTDRAAQDPPSATESVDLDVESWLDYVAFELGEPRARQLALELWGAADLDGRTPALSLVTAASALEDAGLGLDGYFLHCQIFALRAWAHGIPGCWRREGEWWWTELE